MISPAFRLNIVGTEQCDDNLQLNELGEFLWGKPAISSFIFGETYKTALADIKVSPCGGRHVVLFTNQSNKRQQVSSAYNFCLQENFIKVIFSLNMHRQLHYYNPTSQILEDGTPNLPTLICNPSICIVIKTNQKVGQRQD